MSFSQNDLETFDREGLKLHGLKRTSFLAKGSFVEAPTHLGATVMPGALLQVGAFCNLSGGTLNHIRIGRYCSMAQGVVTGSHEHPTDWLTTSRISYLPEVNGWDRVLWDAPAADASLRTRAFPESCPTTSLGHDVWVGQGAYIKAGVTIGHGAIIGARAAVIADVAPYSVVVGVPARVKRLRFPETTIKRLLALQWWNYCLYDFFDIPIDDIEKAMDALETLIETRKIRPFSGPRLDRETLASPERIAAALARWRTPPG